MDYVRFFFGTPARLFVWLVLAGLVTVTIAPGLIAQAFNRLLQEVLGPVMVLGIIYLGFRVMLKGVIGSGGAKKSRR